MPVHETEAIVLRQYPFAEADLVVVFFSREYGRVRALARGAKRPKSRTGPVLEPLNHIRLTFFLRDGAELGRVSECDLIHSYLARTASVERFYVFSYLAELVSELVQDNNPSPVLFRLLLATLETGTAEPLGEGLLRYFELWALRLQGLLPNYEYCSACGTCVKEDGFFLVPETGLGRCRSCARGSGLLIRPGAAELLTAIAHQSPAQFAAGTRGFDALRDLEPLAHRLLELHLEKRLRSYPLVRKALRGSP